MNLGRRDFIRFALLVCLTLANSGLAAATLVVANKAGASASLLDLESGAVVATLPTGNAPHEIGISPDQRFALVSNYGSREKPGNTLTLIDITAATVVKTIDLGEYTRPHGVEWLDQQQAVVTVEANRAVVIVDIDQGAVTGVIETDQEVSHMLALDPARHRVYVTNIGSGSLTIINSSMGVRELNLPTGDGAEGIAVSANGTRAWVTNRDADTVSVIDTESLEIIVQISSAGFPIRAVATPKDQVLVTRARAGDLVIYDATTFQPLRTVAFDLESLESGERLFGDRFGNSSVPIGLVIDETGGFAYVAHANADVITEVELASGTVTRVLRAGIEPDGMGYSALELKLD